MHSCKLRCAFPRKPSFQLAGLSGNSNISYRCPTHPLRLVSSGMIILRRDNFNARLSPRMSVQNGHGAQKLYKRERGSEAPRKLRNSQGARRRATHNRTKFVRAYSGASLSRKKKRIFRSSNHFARSKTLELGRNPRSFARYRSARKVQLKSLGVK